MNLVNRNRHPSDPLAPKTLKFNFGALLKKKMTWHKSVNSLTSTLNECQLDYKDQQPVTSTKPNYNMYAWDLPTHATSGGHLRFAPGSVSSAPAAKSMALVDSIDLEYLALASLEAGRSLLSAGLGLILLLLPLPLTLSQDYLHTPLATNTGGPLACPRSVHSDLDRETAFTTECVSLLNLELTSAMDYDVLHGSGASGHIPYDSNSEEPAADYKVGGYHPVRIGDVYLSDVNSYRILRKLGWGHFLTVWLAVSLLTNEFAALKIVKLGSNYSDAARDEISILKLLANQDEDQGSSSTAELPNIVHLLDDFSITGPHGTHIVVVFELMGETLLHLIHKFKTERIAQLQLHKELTALMPMAMVKSIAKQVLQSVDYMHQHGVVHTDLKPENILFNQVSKTDGLDTCVSRRDFQILPLCPLKALLPEIMESPLTVKVADLGNASHTHYHYTDNIQTRQYRAPEVILQYKSWGALADVWLFGCLLFELLTGDYLFDPRDGQTFTRDDDHLAQIIELVGEFPLLEYLAECHNSLKFFVSLTSMRHIKSLKMWPLMNVLEEKYKFNADDDDVKLVCDLILKCLRYNLEERYDCGLLLQHPWFRENAVHDAKECAELPNNNLAIAGFTREE